MVTFDRWGDEPDGSGCGRVTTDPYDDYYVGSSKRENDTAEMEAAFQALLWLQNEGTHVPAVIISDSDYWTNV